MKALLFMCLITTSVYADKLVSLIRAEHGEIVAEYPCEVYTPGAAATLVLGIESVARTQGMGCKVVASVSGVKTMVCAKKGAMLLVSVAPANTPEECKTSHAAGKVAAVSFSAKK